jgi:hypothetical protein
MPGALAAVGATVEERCLAAVRAGKPAAVMGDVAVIDRLAPLLGIPATWQYGSAFCCVLPGHAEEHPSASVSRGDNGLYAYRDWHERGGCPPALTLAEVYRARLTQRVERIRDPVTHGLWLTRLFLAADLLAALPVPLPPLVDARSAALQRVYAGVQLLFACKWLREPGSTTALSQGFLGPWSGVSTASAARCIRWLYANQIIAKVGEHPSGKGKPYNLYLPVTADQSDGASE